MDNELLKRVLSENSRIIIPGLGAFLRKEQGGVLIFSPFLRTDDGKLSAIIALEYGVSSAEAQLMIGEFAEKMRTILKVKSKYYIDGVGMLMVDNNGVISFLQEEVRATPIAPVVDQTVRPTIVPTHTEPAPAPAPIPARPVAPAPAPVQVQVPVVPQPVQRQQPIPSPMPPRPQPLAAPSPSPFARQAAPAPVAPVAAPNVKPVAARPAPNGNTGQGQPTHKQHKATPVRATKKSKKNDMWLVIAILAAAVVVILMVIGILNSSQLPPIE